MTTRAISLMTTRAISRMPGRATPLCLRATGVGGFGLGVPARRPGVATDNHYDGGLRHQSHGGFSPPEPWFKHRGFLRDFLSGG